MTKPRRPGPPVFFHLRMAGRISLAIAVAGAAGLALVVLLIAGGSAESYRQAVGAYGVARENLGLALLLFGLAMAVVAGIATWLVTLYGTFRFAGPLYRFSRNLELVTEMGAAAQPLPLRRDDELQRECQAFRASVAALQEHYGSLQALAAEAKGLATGTADPGLLEQAIARLKEAESRVRL